MHGFGRGELYMKLWKKGSKRRIKIFESKIFETKDRTSLAKQIFWKPYSTPVKNYIEMNTRNYRYIGKRGIKTVL
jgi:hypothetical protein